MPGRVQDKIAIVTGGGTGIGQGIAVRLAREGAKVVVANRDARTGDETVRLAREAGRESGFGGTAVHVATDVTRDADCRAVVQAAVKQFGGLDVLVNNVGIFEPKPFAEIPDADWHRFFEINVMSGVRMARHYLSGMLKRNWGRILFISSESGVQIPAEMVHYGVTKTAQIAVARGIAESVAGTGVTANSILAGPTESEGVSGFVEAMARQENKSKAEIEKEFFENVRPSSLLKRFATVDEVAAIATYVASELSSATNGAALRVDGGVVRAIL